MKNVRLGRTDLSVSNLCLGTMQFGWTADERASFEVMDAFIGAGGNFIDTADIYSRWVRGNQGGEAEEIVGRWMRTRGNRGGIVVATKVRGEMWKGADGEGLSRAHIVRAVEESLGRLQTDTIDLYQCHWPDENTPIEETLVAFDVLIAAGKVRCVGASNYSAAGLAHALETARAAKLPAFATLQPHHNLVHRAEYEDDLADLCVREGLGVIPYSPLAGGFLTGKYRKGQPMPKSERAGGVKAYLNKQGFAVIETLDGIAAAHASTVAAVALSWELTRPGIQTPIIGANSREQLAALLLGADLTLDPGEIAMLDAVSAGT
jgi:aryl-alcohol dehydrogenase-like predicted oxidoreductase